MEGEKAEISKIYKDLFGKIIIVVQVSAVVALVGYWHFPAIVNPLHAVTVWFDSFTLVLRNLFFVFLLVNVIIFLIWISFSITTGKNKPDIYDEYVAAVPTVIPASSLDYYDVPKAGDVKYNNSNYRESVPEFQAVEESSCTYDREVVKVSSKSYRRTRLEKKKVEYRSTESERVMKTASWRSQTMDGLSSEQFRMTVDTFITEKKKSLHQEMDQWQNGGVPQWQNGGVPQWQSGGVSQWQNGGVPQWQNGVADNWQNGAIQWPNSWQNGGVPQWQNGVADNWQNGVPKLQNGSVDNWHNGVVPQLQNGSVDNWQNGVVQWQGSRDDGNGRHRHGHRSRRHRLVGGSGSNGSDSYLAISN